MYQAWLAAGPRLSAVPLSVFATVVCSSVAAWFISGPDTVRLNSWLSGPVAEALNDSSSLACWACAAMSAVCSAGVNWLSTSAVYKMPRCWDAASFTRDSALSVRTLFANAVFPLCSAMPSLNENRLASAAV